MFSASTGGHRNWALGRVIILPSLSWEIEGRLCPETRSGWWRGVLTHLEHKVHTSSRQASGCLGTLLSSSFPEGQAHSLSPQRGPVPCSLSPGHTTGVLWHPHPIALGAAQGLPQARAASGRRRPDTPACYFPRL